jgi:ribosome-associated protein
MHFDDSAIQVEIETSEITLGQFLKFADIIGSGGDVKWFLSEHTIYVNDVAENRRGRKLHHGDFVRIEDVGNFRVIQANQINKG